MQFIFLNEQTGEQLTMPVTPSRYQLTGGGTVESLDMATVGRLHLPGRPGLFNESMEFLLPAEARSYTSPDYVGQPYDMVRQLVAWSRAGTVLRLIITQTPVNVSVLLGAVTYGEEDGTGDVRITLEVREYRAPGQGAAISPVTGNSHRETAAPPAADSYIVVTGDNLWLICQRFYGEGSLAYKLAAYNQITDPNMIFPRQELRIPPREQL